MSRTPHRTPTVATAEAGEVMLDGPDGMALSLTPEAARRSARSIADAADDAEAQAGADPPEDPETPR